MSQIQLKIHNVFHDEIDFETAQIENEISTEHSDVKTARIAKGNTNSPIYITLSNSINAVSLQTAKRICRRVLATFKRFVPSVSEDKPISDQNIHIKP